jgi:hypothetical protein
MATHHGAWTCRGNCNWLSWCIPIQTQASWLSLTTSCGIPSPLNSLH